MEPAPAERHRASRLSRRRPRRSTRIARVEADYAEHARRAAEIAREHFDAARVLPRFLEVACG